jgi:tetratricopeptide (TPR) repeat protein
MKKSVMIIFALITLGTQAQDGAYQQAMGQALGQFGQAQSAEQLQAAANSFERISAQSPEGLYPYYYAALAMINSSFKMEETASRDQVLERAMAQIERADALHPNNDEIEVLRGYNLMAQLAIDPASRGQRLSPAVMQSFGKAMAMNPQNPRATAMMARQEFGMAQFFGSDTARACGMAAMSIELFEAEKASGFEPNWGRSMAEGLLQQCGQ